jgi:uncharacterized protein (DUF433 family)
MDWRGHLEVDPNTCHGQVRVKGTRIPVSVVLDNLAAGLTREQILAEYPTITPEAITAAIAYAADLASDRIVPIPGA